MTFLLAKIKIEQNFWHLKVHFQDCVNPAKSKPLELGPVFHSRYEITVHFHAHFDYMH